MSYIKNKYSNTFENRVNKKRPKKELIEKIKIAQNKNVIEDVELEVTENEQVIKYKELYRKVKKQLEDERQKNKELLLNKTKMFNEKIKDMRCEIESLKQSNNSLIVNLNDKNEELILLLKNKMSIQDIQSTLNIERTKVFEIKEINAKLLKHNESIFNKVKNVTEVHVENEQLNIKLKGVKYTRDELKRELFNISDKLSVKEREVELLSRINKNYINRSVHDIISDLNNKINIDNWRDFEGISVLHHQLHHYKNKTLYNGIELAEKVFGYINKDDNTITTLDGEIYQVDPITYTKEVENNSPCSAHVYVNKGNVARILFVYENLEDFKYMANIAKKAKKNLNKKQKVYPILGNEKISFITSINGQQLVDKISKYGFDCVWINPFEMGNTIINSNLSSSELVVCYPDYISHGVLDLLDKGSDNIIYTKVFNETLLLNQVMGKIKQIRRKEEIN